MGANDEDQCAHQFSMTAVYRLLLPKLPGTKTNANRQWEVQAAGIKSIQHLCETMLERLLGLALQPQGVQATVQFRFAELHATKRLRDAQTEAMAINNAFKKYQAGWISQDEASEEVIPRYPSSRSLSRPANIAENEAVHLTRQGMAVTYENNGIEQVRHRTAPELTQTGPCPICEPREGLVYNLVGGIVVGDDLPLHNRCVCYHEPVVDAWQPPETVWTG